jgi:glyoxylase-like metal-dependent hydrolase (beta-lactamase superfamily II)
MRRGIVLGVLIAVGTLAAVKAQPPQQQVPKTLTVDKLKDNLYVLKAVPGPTPAGGGNTAVFITATGVVVVDTKNPGWGKPTLDKIKELTPKPITMIINTHTHGDHVSGNVEFPATVDVVAQENTKANMEKMDIFKEHNNVGMAKRTFKDTMTLGKGADQIDLYYFGPGHTNGDAIVVFPALRTAHIGDLFARKGMPLVDGTNGGSVLHYPETVNKVYSGIKNVDVVITGHSDTTMTWPDVKEYANFTQDFLTWAQGELKAGKTPEQAAAGWKLPDKYKGYTAEVSPLMGGLPGRLQRLQEELKK